jgi:hypothetical protein
MAFNFFGTFTTGQWESFKSFTKIQILDLLLRKQWLGKQLIMNGIFSTIYDDNNNPVSYSVSQGSYAAKLLEAYKILGGNPELDMLLRTRDKPVYKLTGTEIQKNTDGSSIGGTSELYSNGRRERGNQFFDRDLGLKVENIKKWEIEAIKMKREKLEFKIKRAMDYSDQLGEEIKEIDKLIGDIFKQGSAENQIIDVEIQMQKPGTMNVVDNITDVHGLSVGKPGDISFMDSEDREKENKERLQK